MYKSAFWILLIRCVDSTSGDIAAAFSSYISSDMYINSIREELIPENCYRMLFRKFQGVVDDEFFDRVLAGNNCDRWPLATDQAPLVSEDYPSTIPDEDFIFSSQVLKLLESIHSRFLGIAIVWPGGHQQSNLLAYQLTTDLTQRSICETTDCRVFRKLVEQFHFRLTLILAGKNPTPNKFDFVFPIRILLTARKFMDNAALRLGQSRDRAVSPFPGCWDWICRRLHRRQANQRASEPGIPLISRRVDWMNTDAFTVFTGHQLDWIVSYLVSVTDATFATQTFASSVIQPLMGISRGVLLSMGETVELRFTLQQIVTLISDVEQGDEKLQKILELSRDIVTRMRAIIAHLSIV